MRTPAALIVLACAHTLVLSLEYEEKYVESRIDHFNPVIRQPNTFRQRMLISDKYYASESGPILVYTGNEGAIDQFWNNSGFVMEVAEEVQGYVVFIEHRYYGKSIPFGSEWMQNNNYQFLTVEQAIADYAVILTDLKKSLGNPKRKVIAFGGSYGGMLTAYMRFKYPNIVDGGLAASAPIFPLGPYDFFKGVTEDCHNHNPECPVTVRRAFAAVLDLASQGSTGYEQLASAFHLCTPPTTSTLTHFLQWARNSFTIMAMADYPYPADFLGKLPAYPINGACDSITGADSPLEGLAKAVVTFYNSTSGPAECLDPAKEYMPCADATGCGLMHQWDIQICLQVRLPSGTNNVTDMFPPMEPWTPNMYTSYCQAQYGTGLSYDRSFFDVDFWSSRIQTTSNLIFSNGDLDPWHYGGVLRNIPEAPFVYPIMIKGGAHHLDLRGFHEQDPASVIDARIDEIRIIKSWLVDRPLAL